jgi:hypothetical protein
MTVSKHVDFGMIESHKACWTNACLGRGYSVTVFSVPRAIAFGLRQKHGARPGKTAKSSPQIYPILPEPQAVEKTLALFTV